MISYEVILHRRNKISLSSCYVKVSQTLLNMFFSHIFACKTSIGQSTFFLYTNIGGLGLIQTMFF